MSIQEELKLEILEKQTIHKDLKREFRKISLGWLKKISDAKKEVTRLNKAYNTYMNLNKKKPKQQKENKPNQNLQDNIKESKIISKPMIESDHSSI